MKVGRILIPTDGSSYAMTAVEYAIYVAKRLDAQLKGFYIVDIRLLQGRCYRYIRFSQLPP